MAGIAIVFPGQGAQTPGMGLSLYESCPQAKALFELADSIRPGTSKQCFGGTPEELMLTVNTQPCLWAVEMAAALALKEAGVSFRAAAGFSLGEITALTFSGTVSLENGFRLVCKRGALMHEAALKQDSAMAAVMKLDAAKVEELCSALGHVWPVNYNSPGQITVSGLRSELEAFMPTVKAAGGLAKLLKVSGAFHSPLMTEASIEFGKALEPVAFHTPQLPLYSNYTGLPYDDTAKTLLTNQINHPVRWQASIEHMAESGIDIFIEAGPGKTLSSLIKRIVPEARTLSVCDADSLKQTLEVLKTC